MSIIISLRNESGDVIDEFVDDSELIVDVVAREKGATLKCLSFLDPFGITVFNGRQLPVVAEEIRTLVRKKVSTVEADVLRRTESLALRGVEGPHRYLWLIGGE